MKSAFNFDYHISNFVLSLLSRNLRLRQYSDSVGFLFQFKLVHCPNDCEQCMQTHRLNFAAPTFWLCLAPHNA